ncbi:MAG TPA: T9SS type A sorting domain-containing protein [Chitinophagaceae bacterium]|nr:T9SS type A sorting domain-containing protein [Chitinophagaceae bacterium]
MIPLYKSPKVKSTLPFELRPFRLLMIVIIVFCTGVQAISQELIFKDPVLESGSAGQNGAIYRFGDVINGVDALVEIKGRSSSSVVLENIDVPNEGWGKAFQPKLGRTGNIVGISNWWMDFEIRFVKAGTTQTANVSKFNITAIDIDGDGLTIKEYIEFYKTASCAVENISSLVTTYLGNSNNGSEKDYRLTGPLLNFLNIDTAGTAVMATAKYENRNKINLRIGANMLGLGLTNAGMRFNSLWFRSFNYVAPRTLPVKLTSFDASLINKKVALTWSTAQEKDASHFVVERSTNGIDFTDAGIIFTEGNSELSRSYSFKDQVSTSGSGILYYRLRMVDLDGQYEYSAIRLIKLGISDGKLELQAFPNPVVNELRITIPESWQNKQVVYELYTNDGQLLKRFLVKSATQTEVINMQNYQPGAYIIKALNDKEIASQRVIKRR